MNRMRFAGFVSFMLGPFAIVLLTAFSGPAGPLTSEDYQLQVIKLAGNLENPWGMAFMPEGSILVSERPGRLRIVKDAHLSEPLAGLPAIARHGQGGLLDVALHPDFASNRRIYFSYTARDSTGVGTEVAFAELHVNRLENLTVIFRMKPKSSTGHHFGSRLVFDDQNHLFITLGDRGDKDRAQRPGDHAGSVIRLHDDGTVPQDNPFVGQPGWAAEKFDLGHRNMQGAAFHPETGALWTHEHGPQGGDEINIVRPGRNYGWPVITYGVNYGIGTKIGEGTSKAGMEQPLHYWVPSIAPSGMTFYTGDKFPAWKGDLLVGALKDRMLVRLELSGEQIVHEERFLKDEIGRIRDVRQGPDGYIYLLTDEKDGGLYRLEPVN